MSDFYKPLGKDMHEEPSDKLFILESEGFVSAGFIVLDPEGNGFFTDLKDPGVADGDARSRRRTGRRCHVPATGPCSVDAAARGDPQADRRGAGASR